MWHLWIALLACGGPSSTDTDTDTDGTDTDTDPTGHTGDTGREETGETGDSGHSGTVDPRTDEEILTEAFLWGFPLVLSTRSVGSETVNHITWGTHRPDASNRGIVVPNPDVLYALTPIDLRAEPVVIHTADLADRYWVIQFADYWVETFTYVGTRSTAGAAADYLVTAPGWKGTVPEGMTRIDSPLEQLLLVPRMHVLNDADEPVAVALTDQIWAKPLSTVLGTEPPKPLPRTVLTGEPKDTGLNGILFWDELGAAMAMNAPRAEEQRFADDLARFGIGPGRTPSTEVTDLALRDLLSRLPGEQTALVHDSVPYGGWSPVLENVGNFYGDWLTRAAVSWDAWISHQPIEATYAISDLYTTDTNWTLHFDASELPPIEEFWSVTVYAEDRLLVDNPLDQYSVQSTDPLVEYNPDGSVDIWFQRSDQILALDGIVNRYNVVPIPNSGSFYLILRLYVPTAPILDGTWAPPDLTSRP